MDVQCDIPTPPSATTIVTTVHGTFAHGATWVEPNSPFCTRLSVLGGGNVVINPFRWSGANNGVARLVAAEQLKEYLVEQFRLHPEARHFVIAHSHGGNVALYAIRDPLLQQKMAGVVCLSTPFLSSFERKLSTRLSVSFQIFVFLTPVALYTIPLFFLNPARFGGWWALGIAPLMWAVISMNERLDKWRGRKLSDVSAAMKDAQIPQMAFGQVLIVRGTGDEAASALSTAQFISFVIRKLFTFSERLMDRLDSFVQAVYKTVYHSKWTVVLVAGIAMLGLLDWLRPAAGEVVIGWVRRPALVFASFFLIWMGILLAFGFLVVMVLFALGLVFLSFDEGSVLAGMFFDLSVEPSPPGQWLTYQLPPSGDGDLVAKGLRHSLYEDPLAAGLVWNWMRSRMGG